MTISTIILLLQILDIKSYRLRIRLALTERKKTHRTTSVHAGKLPPLPLRSLFAFLLYPFDLKFWVPFCIYGIHVPPFEVPYWLGLLMFLRMSLFFDLIKVNSTVYRQRHTNRSRFPNAPWINTTLTKSRTLRTFLTSHPILFGGTSTTVLIFVFGYSIHVLERGIQTFTFAQSLWISTGSILLMWPDDVYGAWNPISWGSRLVCVLGSMVGMVLSAFIISAFIDLFVCSQHEKKLLQWHEYTNIVTQHRDRASRLLQFVIRSFLYERKLVLLLLLIVISITISTK